MHLSIIAIVTTLVIVTKNLVNNVTRSTEINYRIEGTTYIHNWWCSFNGSVADPNLDPDPPDPRVLGPPGSGSESISQRYGFGSGYGSGSRTFCQQAKIVRKTLIPTVL